MVHGKLTPISGKCIAKLSYWIRQSDDEPESFLVVTSTTLGALSLF